jgi:hypothetical protein
MLYNPIAEIDVDSIIILYNVCKILKQFERKDVGSYHG